MIIRRLITKKKMCLNLDRVCVTLLFFFNKIKKLNALGNLFPNASAKSTPRMHYSPVTVIETQTVNRPVGRSINRLVGQSNGPSVGEWLYR